MQTQNKIGIILTLGMMMPVIFSGCVDNSEELPMQHSGLLVEITKFGMMYFADGFSIGFYNDAVAYGLAKPYEGKNVTVYYTHYYVTGYPAYRIERIQEL